MAYTPTVWKNGEFPPIDAEHLNKIEQGIANSAPAGYGLGEDATIPEGRSANNITASGFYYCDKDTPNSNDWVILHIQRDVGYAVQFGRTYNQGSGWPIVTRVRNANISNAWQPWEWLTPPMELGVEYRTTERYLGKPVYCKVIDCGAVPDANTNKTVDFADLGISRIISWTGNVDVGGNTFALPYQEIGREAGNATIYVFVNYDGITLRTDSRWFAENGGTAQCTIWYTKTPD